MRRGISHGRGEPLGRADVKRRYLLRDVENAPPIFQATLPHDARVFRDAFVYGAVIVVLLVRPQGLFAPKSARQRV